MLIQEVKQYTILSMYIEESERRDYYSTNLSILNILSYSDWNLFKDAKILRTREIMMLFKLQIPQFYRFFLSFLAGPPISIYYPFRTFSIPWLCWRVNIFCLMLLTFLVTREREREKEVESKREREREIERERGREGEGRQ